MARVPGTFLQYWSPLDTKDITTSERGQEFHGPAPIPRELKKTHIFLMRKGAKTELSYTQEECLDNKFGNLDKSYCVNRESSVSEQGVYVAFLC